MPDSKLILIGQTVDLLHLDLSVKVDKTLHPKNPFNCCSNSKVYRLTVYRPSINTQSTNMLDMLPFRST